MNLTDKQRADMIPIGSWDLTNPAAHFENGGKTPRFSPGPFFDSEDASERDRTMFQALELLCQLGILSYELSWENRGLNGHTRQLGTRLLIYAHDRRRPSSYEYCGNNQSIKTMEKAAETKRALTLVLLNINVDPWRFHNPTMHTDASGNQPPALNMFPNDTNKRLIDIYNEMPSPLGSDDPYLDQPIRMLSKATKHHLQQTIERDSPRGMRTKLYQYQKNSLWKLMRRELCPDLMLDPSTVTLHDMNGDPYYLDLAANESYISRKPFTLWEDIPGGIICEDMGTGKTCLCIALILHTLHQSSRPPAEEPTTIYCDLIPSTPSAASVDSDFTELVLPKGSAIPSLRDFAAATIKTRAVNYRHAQDYLNPDLMDTLENSLLYYHEEASLEQNRQSRSRRHKTTDSPIEIYLSSATLVIVPANLVDQWWNEINKHTEDGALKVFAITNVSQEFPELRTLLQYDLVLISQSRFAREYIPGPYSVKRSFDLKRQNKSNCQCATVYDRCRCLPPREISPLMQIRWKRVIVDEGHSVGIKMSDHSLHAQKLHADRRWICTGTPTANLANLQPLSTTGTRGSVNPQQQNFAVTDRMDLDRLSVLITNFLRLPPYTSDHSRFSKEILKPLVDHQQLLYAAKTSSGFDYNGALEKATSARYECSLEGASSAMRLKYLLERIMVRNRTEDVEKDVTLPPLRERIVLLDLEYFQMLALNCQIALIHANAVLSEREDQDYFFHPSSRKDLARVIENLKDGCFWYMGGPEYVHMVTKSLENVNDALDKHNWSGGTKYSREDHLLLLDISEHLRAALESAGWRKIVVAQEVGYYCQDIPALVQVEHAVVPSTILYATASDSSNEDLSERLHMENKAEEAPCVMLGKKISSLRSKVLKTERDMELEYPDGPATVQQISSSIDPVNASMANNSNQHSSILKEAMSRRQLSKSTILSSTSSKLNYIISQILRHQGSEKCVVFCQSETIMYYIHEYLTLANVRCLVYHTHRMSESERSSNITTFNTSENVSAIIMQTDLAAYGIDLSSASRVYFVSPVWKTDTLRQAIKRAHRIGQTRPVFVETLVIRDSFEEKILNRRREIDDSARQQSAEPATASSSMLMSPLESDPRDSSSLSPAPLAQGGLGETRRERRKSSATSKSGSVKRQGKEMLDDGKVQDLIKNLEFMTSPRAHSHATVRAQVNSRPIVASSHRIPTLVDYVGLLDEVESASCHDLNSKLRIPVVYPARGTEQAQQQLSEAHDNLAELSIVDALLVRPLSEIQDGDWSGAGAYGGSEGESSSQSRLRLCFDVDADMEVVEEEIINTEVLSLPHQENTREYRPQRQQMFDRTLSLTSSEKEMEVSEERRQQQEMELRLAKEGIRDAQNRQRLAEQELQVARQRLSMIMQEQRHSRGEGSARAGSSVRTSIALDSDDDIVDDAEIKRLVEKKEEKDVRLKLENIKLEGTPNNYSSSRQYKQEQVDKKVKLEVKAEDYNDIKRPFAIKSDNNDFGSLLGDVKVERPHTEYYELLDYSDDEGKKFKLETGLLNDDTITVVDSDGDDTTLSVSVTAVGCADEQGVGAVVGAGVRRLDLDMKVDMEVLDQDIDYLPRLQQRSIKREIDNPQYQEGVDLMTESRLKKRVRF
ncbi:hypothetical protein EC991_008051 [Linnemannia zychae]|nr:hypothetical protein EC991_008051 [Linnemannia zychae]